jgi:acetyltransferase
MTTGYPKDTTPVRGRGASAAGAPQGDAIELVQLDVRGLHAYREPLIDLLVDAVTHGSSVGFVLPLPRTEAGEYWEGLAPSIGRGERLLWIARVPTPAGARVAGTAQLELTQKRNGINRAEVQKVLVHSGERRGGVGRLLMAEVERVARGLDRGLLFLDTEAGSGAEPFYRALGFTCIGGLPEYACSPHGEWRANAIYYKTLFTRGTKGTQGSRA